VKLTTRLHLVPGLRVYGVIPPFLIHLSRYCTELSNGYVFVKWYLVKYRDNFIFTLILG